MRAACCTWRPAWCRGPSCRRHSAGDLVTGNRGCAARRCGPTSSKPAAPKPTRAQPVDHQGAATWIPSSSGGADHTPSLWRIHRTIGMGGDKLVAEVGGEETEQAHGEELREEWERNYAEVEEEACYAGLLTDREAAHLAGLANPRVRRRWLAGRLDKRLAAVGVAEEAAARVPHEPLLQPGRTGNHRADLRRSSHEAAEELAACMQAGAGEGPGRRQAGAARMGGLVFVHRRSAG